MSGNINPQEVATQFLMGDHIREDICSRKNLPILMAMELQTEIMACGEMTIALPKTKTGRIKKEVVKKLADGHEHVVADLADIIEKHSHKTKSKPPRETRVVLTIDEVALHGATLSDLCNKLIAHRKEMDKGELDGSTKVGRAVINALAVEAVELLETHGEEVFRRAASQLLAKKQNKGHARNATLNQLMANVLSACLPQANLGGLKKKLQRLRKA